MPIRMDINADMGESFGRWSLGSDADLMPYLTSANIACGYHGGDPHVMRASVRLAKEHNVAIGAHVSLPDLLGFGRRRLAISEYELKDYVTYQVGALEGFAAAEGARLEHVKPHGAMYVMCTEEDKYAEAVVAAIKELPDDLILLLTGVRVARAAQRMGVRFVMEGYIDLDYDAEGKLILERAKKARDPEEVAERAVVLAKSGKVPVAGGGFLDLPAHSVCVHGDAPNAPEIARAVRDRLAGAGVELRSLRELA